MRLLLTALMLVSFAVSAAPLKLYDADRELYYQDTTGSGTSADPYGVGITITNSMETSAEGNTAVKTYIQDQTTQAIDIWFTKFIGTATTATVASQGEYSVTMEPGHGIVTGYVIESRTADNYVQALVTNVVSDTITVNTPWSRTFPIGTVVDVGNPNMNVLAAATSASAAVYSISPSALQTIDITRVIVTIEDATAMDFTTFGGGSSLTNGVTVRKLNTDGNFTNFFSLRSNGDMFERGFDVGPGFLNAVGGAGPYGFAAKRTWAGQNEAGVSLRVDGANSQELQFVIQDDLTGLTKFRAIAQGHVVQ